MRRLAYFARQALRGIRRGPLVQLASAGVLATGLLLAGAALLAAVNIDRLTREWGRGVEITAYLARDAAPARVAALERLLRGRPEIAGVRRVSSEEARRRLARSLGPEASLLEGVEPDFLPASLEASLRAGTPRERVRPLLALLDASPVVAEVDDSGLWAERLARLAGILRGGGLAASLLMALACLQIVASTIRLGVYARRDEIEIQKLVGATDGFVRAPFLVEGAIQGLAGATAATLLLYGAFRWAAPRLESALGAIVADGSLAFFSPAQVAAGVVAGALLGLAGSRFAVGRYLRV